MPGQRDPGALHTLDFREKGLTKEHLIAKEYRSEKFSEYRYYIDFDESAGYIPL